MKTTKEQRDEIASMLKKANARPWRFIVEDDTYAILHGDNEGETIAFVPMDTSRRAKTHASLIITLVNAAASLLDDLDEAIAAKERAEQSAESFERTNAEDMRFIREAMKDAGIMFAGPQDGMSIARHIRMHDTALRADLARKDAALQVALAERESFRVAANANHKRMLELRAELKCEHGRPDGVECEVCFAALAPAAPSASEEGEPAGIRKALDAMSSPSPDPHERAARHETGDVERMVQEFNDFGAAVPFANTWAKDGEETDCAFALAALLRANDNALIDKAKALFGGNNTTRVMNGIEVRNMLEMLRRPSPRGADHE